jgi:hypothetical protein
MEMAFGAQFSDSSFWFRFLVASAQFPVFSEEQRLLFRIPFFLAEN